MTKINVGDILIPIDNEGLSRGVKYRIVVIVGDTLVWYDKIMDDGTVARDGWYTTAIADIFYIINPKKIEFKKQIDSL